jgi:hypothetical protein
MFTTDSFICRLVIRHKLIKLYFFSSLNNLKDGFTNNQRIKMNSILRKIQDYVYQR